MYKSVAKMLIKKSMLNSQILVGGLILLYCLLFGVTSYVILTGVQLFFFLSSLVLALSIVHVRDPESRKQKVKQSLLYNQVFGVFLLITYIVVYGASSFSILTGIQLVFFMCSYIFAMSLFYIRDPERIKKEEVSVSTTSPFIERTPCFMNSSDMSWLVRELNSSLSTIIGFSELMLTRKYTESEQDYMMKHIYEKTISISNTVSKVSSMIEDNLVKPKELSELEGNKVEQEK